LPVTDDTFLWQATGALAWDVSTFPVAWRIASGMHSPEMECLLVSKPMMKIDCGKVLDPIVQTR